MKTILAIALGGALGSVLRHGTNVAALKLVGDSFPWGTFIVNIAGSFIIGLLTGIFALYWQPSPEMRVFLVTGFLGGFTTFSSFSLDFTTLWQSGAVGSAVTYAVLSVVLSIGALFLALFLVRTVAA
jgi:CrcB protein